MSGGASRLREPAFLPAKSVRAGRAPVTLGAHSLAVERAALRLFEPGRRAAESWARLFRLRSDEQRTRFLLNLRVACLLHDLGKANLEFVALATGDLKGAQTFRHEHISAVVVALPAIAAWLRGCTQIDPEVVLAAVLSHHIKAGVDGEWRWAQPRTTSSRVALLLEHGDVRRILARVSAIAGLPAAPVLPAGPFGPFSPWEAAFASGRTMATTLGRSIRRDHDRRSVLLAVKAALVVADSVASGLMRERIGVDSWIDGVAHMDPLSPTAVRSAVLEPRARQIAAASGRAFTLAPFQEAIAAKGRRVLLIAGCGTGKTLAAWRWAEAMAGQQRIGRVVFLYPTRGTATEGFKDYVGWAPESDAALVHASSNFELEGIAANPSEATRGKQYADEEQSRLFALGLWPRRYFSATVDQFLGFLQHSYRSLCLTPVLADCALVIDEVHSFDRKMFEGLTALLREFDVPVLCMTATLTPDRRRQLEELGLTVYPGPDDASVSRALADIEGRPRYAIEAASGADEVLEAAVAAHREGRRVLWVVNTVARCQELGVRLRQHVEAVHLYHSRFTLSDRFAVHGRTVAAFRKPTEPALAVTTQVCEMSLDLDADLLITETAPIPSLVQRMGRANRHLARGEHFRARVLVYRAPADLPYTREDHEAARAFLETVSGSSVSQARLAEALAAHVPSEALVEQTARFLEAGAYATPGSFREDDVGTARCVLDADVEEVRSLLTAGRPIDGFVVALPSSAVRGLPAGANGLPPFLHVVPSVNYHPASGYVIPGKD